MDDLTRITQSGLIDSEAIDALRADFAQVRSTAQVMRTRTEMEVSVLGDLKHPTPDAKYWQATREADVQYRELAMLSFEYRRQVLKIRELEADLADAEGIEAERLDIDLDEARYVLAEQERVARHRLRELSEWADIRARLKPQCQYGTEEVGAHQLAAMRKRFDAQAQALTGGEGVADRMNILGLKQTAKRVEGER